MSKDEYAIYLHTNGNLIHKPNIVYANDPEYFDSPFVQRVWYVNPREWNIKDYTAMLEDAKAMGASMSSLQEYMTNWSLSIDL